MAANPPPDVSSIITSPENDGASIWLAAHRQSTTERHATASARHRRLHLQQQQQPQQRQPVVAMTKVITKQNSRQNPNTVSPGCHGNGWAKNNKPVRSAPGGWCREEAFFFGNKARWPGQITHVPREYQNRPKRTAAADISPPINLPKSNPRRLISYAWGTSSD